MLYMIKDMEVLKLSFLALVLTKCYFRINAMGLCEFDEVTCKVNKRAECSTHQGTQNVSRHVKATNDQTTTGQVEKANQVTTGTATTGQAATAYTSTEQVEKANQVTTGTATTGQATTAYTSTEQVEKANQVTTGTATTGQATTAYTSTEQAITTAPVCPPNMAYANCSKCQGTCLDPKGCITNCTEPEICACNNGFLLKAGVCVPEEECGCFIKEVGVIQANEIYVNENCSEYCNCDNGQLIRNQYTCSPNATCGVKDGARQCYCNEGYMGDGGTCTLMYTDCYDVYLAGHRQDGVNTILPAGWPGPPFNVSCDMTTSEGGWTLFQRRIDHVTDFYRYWEDYKHGFGSLEQGKDFWLGNEQIHYLTNQKVYKLRVDIITSNDLPKYGWYNFFILGNESTQYRLRIDDGTYHGDAGNGMHSTDGVAFSTRDRDNDGTSCNCSAGHRGAWWYTNKWCELCYQFGTDCNVFPTTPGCFGYCCVSNPNGNYNASSGESITWDFDHCNVKAVEMKIRPFSAFQMS